MSCPALRMPQFELSLAGIAAFATRRPQASFPIFCEIMRIYGLRLIFMSYMKNVTQILALRC